MNAQNAPEFFDEPRENTRIVLPERDASGDIHLAQPAGKAKSSEVPFTVPVAHLALNYLPGGYPLQPQTVILRPIAEHTSIADGTPWIFWFKSHK